MALTKGVKAPHFSLPNTDRKMIQLSDFAGKTLIINFFPAAFTGVCTEQVCTNQGEMGFFKPMGAEVIGISVDMPFSLKAFKERHAIDYDLLSDFNKLTIHEYEMYHCNFTLGIKGVAKRGVAIVDKNGMIAYFEETANLGKQINFSQLKDELRKLMAHA